ncbi:uncharacterized protein LOC144935604 [Lampetra fluviatilis]
MESSTEGAVMPAEEAFKPKGDALTRVSQLPLVELGSRVAWDAYGDAKRRNRALSALCGLAELWLRGVAALAKRTGRPLASLLESQLAFANDIACLGLDAIEERVPMLHQTPDKVMARAMDAGSVAVESARGLATAGLSALMSTKVGEVAHAVVELTLSRAEMALECYLPDTGDEEEADASSSSSRAIERRTGKDGVDDSGGGQQEEGAAPPPRKEAGLGVRAAVLLTRVARRGSRRARVLVVRGARAPRALLTSLGLHPDRGVWLVSRRAVGVLQAALGVAKGAAGVWLIATVKTFNASKVVLGISVAIPRMALRVQMATVRVSMRVARVWLRGAGIAWGATRGALGAGMGAARVARRLAITIPEHLVHNTPLSWLLPRFIVSLLTSPERRLALASREARVARRRSRVSRLSDSELPALAESQQQQQPQPWGPRVEGAEGSPRRRGSYDSPTRMLMRSSRD